MAVIDVAERLDRDGVRDVVRDLDRALRAQRSPVVLDLGRAEVFDSAGLAAVVDGIRRARRQGVEVKLRGLSDSMREFFSLVSVDRLIADREPPPREHAVTKVGAAVEPTWRTFADLAALGVQTARETILSPLRGRRLRLDRAVLEVDHAANGGLPIVVLISFLLGLVLAMQAYVQLRIWGAEIYIADMVGVSVTSEIGPLMTAIILAARSGGSNAAQLGSMTIGEEVDALVQMGVHPIRFLVVPKVIALAFASVALGLVFDAVAICGGALFAFTVAEIEPGAYLEQTRTALQVDEFTVGKLKSLVFGAAVGIVSCGLGLKVRGGSEGVARATTNAVVLGIFLIIVIDAVFVSVQRMILS